MQDVYRAKLSSVDTMELKGYELIKELFVDSSGMGAADEPALIQSQFKTELTELLKKHGSLTAKITNAGQFQVYVGLFKRNGASKMHKVANNTYMINTENGFIIRLHDTDILSIDGDENFYKMFNDCKNIVSIPSINGILISINTTS